MFQVLQGMPLPNWYSQPQRTLYNWCKSIVSRDWQMPMKWIRWKLWAVCVLAINMYITALLAYGIFDHQWNNFRILSSSYWDIYDITKNCIQLYQKEQKYVLIEKKSDPQRSHDQLTRKYNNGKDNSGEWIKYKRFKGENSKIELPKDTLGSSMDPGHWPLCPPLLYPHLFA